MDETTETAATCSFSAQCADKCPVQDACSCANTPSGLKCVITCSEDGACPAAASACGSDGFCLMDYGTADGTDGTEPPGPTSCTEDGDCVGECPGAGADCECFTTPIGDTCQTPCDTTDDCPTDVGQAFICAPSKFCAPEGGPPG